MSQFYDSHTSRLQVFLSETSDDVRGLREELQNVLRSAEMEVVLPPYRESGQPAELSAMLSKVNCSVHIIGSEYGPEVSSAGISLSEHQLRQANEQANRGDYFKLFVWQPRHIARRIADMRQQRFVNTVRNTIVQNIIFSTHTNTIKFVEDIRSVMAATQQSEVETHASDVFFIYNDVDHDRALGIIDLLSDVSRVESLNIVQDSLSDYTDLIQRQMRESKLGVIFFSRSTEWALPFVQQTWKLTGGASSPIPLLFIGDDNIEANHSVSFEAPNVVSRLVSEEMVPLEVKVWFDKLVNGSMI